LLTQKTTGEILLTVPWYFEVKAMYSLSCRNIINSGTEPDVAVAADLKPEVNFENEEALNHSALDSEDSDWGFDNGLSDFSDISGFSSCSSLSSLSSISTITSTPSHSLHFKRKSRYITQDHHRCVKRRKIAHDAQPVDLPTRVAQFEHVVSTQAQLESEVASLEWAKAKAKLELKAAKAGLKYRKRELKSVRRMIARSRSNLELDWMAEGADAPL
jgi:hypothetical protein